MAAIITEATLILSDQEEGSGRFRGPKPLSSLAVHLIRVENVIYVENPKRCICIQCPFQDR